jgi:hypothetical protein
MNLDTIHTLCSAYYYVRTCTSNHRYRSQRDPTKEDTRDRANYLSAGGWLDLLVVSLTKDSPIHTVFLSEYRVAV